MRQSVNPVHNVFLVPVIPVAPISFDQRDELLETNAQDLLQDNVLFSKDSANSKSRGNSGKTPLKHWETRKNGEEE
jgi:hypothetical protein